MQRKSVRDDFYEQERFANQELRRFRANYPENAALIQNYVEDACDRMDYEGSRMYDEYPDRYMLKKNCASISNRIKKDSETMGVEAGFAKKCQNLPKETLDDLVEVLFYNEVYRRRLRRRRGKRFYP